MPVLRRVLYLLGAVAAMAAAFLLLTSAGLPDRAMYTGQIISDTVVAPEILAVAPDFALATLTGDTIRLSQARGAPVILNFWATWCGPCAVEMPILQSIFETRRATGLRILAVNLGEPKETIRRWQESHNLTYDLLVDEAQQVAALYHLRGQPTTYIIAPDGRIARIFFGPITADTLNTALERLDS